MIFDLTTKFKTRNEAEGYVVRQARTGSSFHIDTLAVVKAARIESMQYRRKS